MAFFTECLSFSDSIATEMTTFTTITTVTVTVTASPPPPTADLASVLGPVLATNLAFPPAAAVQAGPNPWGPALVVALLSPFLGFGLGLLFRVWDKKGKEKKEKEEEEKKNKKKEETERKERK